MSAMARAGKLTIVGAPFIIVTPWKKKSQTRARWWFHVWRVNQRKSSLQAGGAFTFVTSMAGWWIFFAIMLASLDFPFNIPVGDLSHIIKGASEKQKAKDAVWSDWKTYIEAVGKGEKKKQENKKQGGRVCLNIWLVLCFGDLHGLYHLRRVGCLIITGLEDLAIHHPHFQYRVHTLAP